VKRVRVLVANQPRLMRELVMATISDQPDIELVGEVVDEANLPEVVETGSTRCAHSGDERDPEESGPVRFLLGRYPQMRILALAPEQKPRNLLLGPFVDIRTKRWKARRREF